METPQPVVETSAKKNQTPLIIAAVVIVLCCCCVVLAVAGYIGFVRINSMQSSAPQPVEDAVPVPTDEATVEPSTSLGEAPSGGLGDDILRNDTWQYVAAAAQGQGRDQPLGAESTIDVLQEPDNGVWVEQWNVACASGDSYSYEVQFTLDDTGATFDIKPLQ